MLLVLNPSVASVTALRVTGDEHSCLYASIAAACMQFDLPRLRMHVGLTFQKIRLIIVLLSRELHADPDGI